MGSRGNPGNWHPLKASGSHKSKEKMIVVVLSIKENKSSASFNNTFLIGVTFEINPLFDFVGLHII